MKDWILSNAKALTALVASIIAALAAHYALHLDPGFETTLASLVVALAVYFVPNTPKPPPPAPDTPKSGLPPTIFGLLAMVLCGCGFFTPARVAELVDIACVVEHFELNDAELSKVCGLLERDVPAAREQGKKTMAATRKVGACREMTP
jgi:hypothetical protein